MPSTTNETQDPIISQSNITLEHQEQCAVYTLSNQDISVSCIPALGGKINSITYGDFEFLSRSNIPYRKRQYAANFYRTEVDGIDECFPALNVSNYPTAPWQGTRIPDHGEICQLAWDVVQADKDGIHCSVKGKAFPYEFTRIIQLNDQSITLSYRVKNLSEHPFHCNYAFHPLFKANRHTRLHFDDDTKIQVEVSSRNFLGRNGRRCTWGTFTTRSGALFKEQQFTPSNRRSFQYFTLKNEVDQTQIDFGGNYNIQMSWTQKMLPHIGVWCNQGGNPRINQVAPEPCNSNHGRLDHAFQAQEHLTIDPHAEIAWTISLKLNGPPAVNASNKDKKLEQSAQSE